MNGFDCVLGQDSGAFWWEIDRWNFEDEWLILSVVIVDRTSIVPRFIFSVFRKKVIHHLFGSLYRFEKF